MPQFKTYEEKCLFELDRLENENAELKEQVEDHKIVVESYEKREQKFKDLLALFNLHYHDCTTADEPMLDVDTIFPHDKEQYAKAKALIEELGLEVYRR